MQVSCGSFERAHFSDSIDIIFGVLTCISSIVTSRKRKLRELFAVATQSEGLPHPVLTNPDAPTTTPAEWQFLQANDIFQYVATIDPTPFVDILRAFAAAMLNPLC